MKKITILLLILLFLVINGAVYSITQTNGEQRIQLALDENLKTLKTHYDILIQTQKTTADILYQSTLESDRLIQIISKAFNAPKEQKTRLRDELHELLREKYKRAKLKDVYQYHFVFPNNESFLRMHKPEKFGDDLSTIRYDFKYVNMTKQTIRGFTQGRTSHGFRNTFPLFDRSGKYIGAMEVSFSSDSFQWYLNNISHIHTHFLVEKKIFEAKTWKKDDIVEKYSQSSENSRFMLALDKTHSKDRCITENRLKLKPIKEELLSKMSIGEMFSSYVRYKGEIKAFAYLPIKNMKYETVAWLVSYENSPFIALSLKNMLIMRIITLVFSLILIYFIVALVRSNESTEKKRKLLDEILDSTDNIMFITDLKKVSFSNNRFKNLLNIKYSNEFNRKTADDVLSIFAKVDGYLHADLLKGDESLISLIRRTPQDERIVCILDRHFEEKAFQISISKVNYENDFLVTLSDITQMKAKQAVAEKKAYKDGLTGIYNRNKFDEIFNEELIRVKRDNAKLVLAIVDIDKFKNFNDTFGHLIGDEVLISMTESVDKNLRESDVFARWGGEEFVILFKDTSMKNAKRVSQKLKDKIQKAQHPIAGSITASFGLSEYIVGDTVESLFERCDKALYLAKENGRNRIEIL